MVDPLSGVRSTPRVGVHEKKPAAFMNPLLEVATSLWLSATPAGTQSAGLRAGTLLSIDGAGWYNPLARLARDPSDQLEVIVVMKQRESCRLGSSGDEQIRDLPSSLAP